MPRPASPHYMTPTKSRGASPVARPPEPRRGRSPATRAASPGSCYRCVSHGSHVHGRSRSPAKRAASPRPRWVQPTNHATQPPTAKAAPSRVGRHKTLDSEWAISTDVLTSREYPNWTLGNKEQKVKTLPSKPESCEPPHTGPRAEPKPAKSITKDISSYPNWTLPQEERRGSPMKKRVGSPARPHWNKNDDIQGSKPALRKFSPRNRKIVADPWPDRNTCPVQGGQNKQRTNTITPWEDVKKVQVDGRGRDLPRDDHQLYNVAKGTLRTKEVETFRNGKYVTTEVVTHRSPGPTRGCFQEKLDSPRAARGSPSLTTSDIQGAQPRTPRSRTPVRRASGILDTSDIEGAKPRTGTPSRPRPPPPPVDTHKKSHIVNTTPRKQAPSTPARQQAAFNHATMFASQITFF